jgi:hypothetical protein
MYPFLPLRESGLLRIHIRVSALPTVPHPHGIHAAPPPRLLETLSELASLASAATPAPPPQAAAT